MDERSDFPQGGAVVPPPLIDPGVQKPPPPLPFGRGARRLLRFAYNHNPFYAISAFLVLWGLSGSFNPAEGVYETAALMIGMAGYAVLLGLVAYLLIRFGQLWEDVRTILVVIVVFFLAISVSLDGTFARDLRFGSRCFAGGLAFSIALSEVVLRGTRLALPARFRVAYYLILALFFVYPVVAFPIVTTPGTPWVPWVLFGFTSVAGVTFLSLLPAVWAGPEYVRRRESRLPWPLFPWTLFVVLGAGVCIRSYCLCVSFYTIKGTGTIFSAYFLVPFLLSANVLLLELGRRSRSARTMLLATLAPLGLLALAATGCRPRTDDMGFTELFITTLGATPIYLTLVACAAFYCWCILRKIPLATWALTAALGVLCVWGPTTSSFGTLVFPQAVPLALIAAVQLVLGVRRRSPVRTLLALWCLIAAATLWCYGSPMTDYRGLIPLHLGLAAMILVGGLFRGAAARGLQHASAGVLLAVGVAAIFVDPAAVGNPPPMLLAVYPGLATAVAIFYGLAVRNRAFQVAAAGILTTWTADTGWDTYQQLRESIAGLDKIALGLLCLALGLLVSLAKMGVPQRWLLRQRE